MQTDVVTMDKIVSLSKRRGFVLPSSEIYGGLGSSYDYGHYGVLLKNNVKGQWWRAMLQERDDIVALDSAIILHPETAQGIFLNFKNYLQFSRKKPPFGIAQIGKSFRNEITPGNFIFRTREFEQMEMEFFVPPDQAEQWFEHWLEQRMNWYARLGIRSDHLRLRAHDQDELSHYSSATSDIEYLFPIGWSELEGIANRGDFDLRQHAAHSGQKLEYVD